MEDLVLGDVGGEVARRWGHLVEPKETVKNDKGGRGPVKNKPIVLSDGTWLAPASLEGPMPGQKRKQWRAFADISIDLGKTWKPSSIILPSENGYGNIQPTVWESEPDTCAHASQILSRSKRDVDLAFRF